MHYPLCVLVEMPIIADGRPKPSVAREAAIAAIEPYKGLEYDYVSDSPSKFPWLDSTVLLGQDNKGRFLELLYEFQKVPLQNAKLWWQLAVRESERVSQEHASKILSFDASKPNEIIGAILTESALEIAFQSDSASSEGKFFSYIANALAAVTGAFQCDNCFYSEADRSSKISLWTLEEVQSHPENYALVFFDLHV